MNPKTLYRWISKSKHKAWQHTNRGAKKTAVYLPSLKSLNNWKKIITNLKLYEKDLEIAILRDLIKKEKPELSDRIEIAYKWIAR
jgi:hypothetical protein